MQSKLSIKIYNENSLKGNKKIVERVNNLPHNILLHIQALDFSVAARKYQAKTVFIDYDYTSQIKYDINLKVIENIIDCQDIYFDLVHLWNSQIQ